LPAEFRSNLGAFIGATERAIKSGLIAAAESYMAEVRTELLKGYTTGDFVTGHVAGSVDKGPVEKTPDGYGIAIGSNVDYALYWEVGFVPARGVFSPGVGTVTQGPIGVQRKEVWVPKMVEMREVLVAIVAEEIKAVDGAL
jgi:hypothetical protein